MKKTQLSIVTAMLGVALLSGCSAGEAAESEASASADASTPVLGSVDDAGGRAPSGVTGEIAYVADGVAQVQDGSTQTAVSFDDDTTVTQQVEIALADIEVGACVVATLGDDDTATTISVTEADEDGTCSTGFGGGMGGFDRGEMPADGEMPTDMPTAMPDGGEIPDGAPTAMPDGGEMPGGGFDAASLVAGTVTSVADGELTVESTDGEESTVTAASDATITGTEDADLDAIEVGRCMTASGESDTSGGYAATTISVFAPGDDGCVSAMGFGGGRGGMPGGGEMPGGDATVTDEPALESAS